MRTTCISQSHITLSKYLGTINLWKNEVLIINEYTKNEQQNESVKETLE